MGTTVTRRLPIGAYDDTKKQRILQQWRKDTVRQLVQKNMVKESGDLLGCATNYRVDVCKSNVGHKPKAICLHCGSRGCPDCARRDSYRLMLSYLPKLTELLETNPSYPDYRLRKLVLTTPYELKKLTSAAFKIKQKLVIDFLNIFFFDHFKQLGKLSPGEIRRGRCDLGKHGIGGLQAAEFGERTHHLHWHILIYAPYMLKKAIWEAWERVTGGECTNVKINEIRAFSAPLEGQKDGLVQALQETAKYTTKFQAIKPADMPHFLTVLKGNRRVRAFGVLYNCKATDEEIDRVCEVCKGERLLVTSSTYIHQCEITGIEPDDSVTIAVEQGISLYLSRNTEISLGYHDSPPHKARDSLEGD